MTFYVIKVIIVPHRASRDGVTLVFCSRFLSFLGQKGGGGIANSRSQKVFFPIFALKVRFKVF